MNPTKADLHIHSTASDGVLTPNELAAACLQSGITLMAITDHDTFAGSDRLCASDPDIPVIPGVELSMRDLHGLHLLGYGLSPALELRERVAGLASRRDDRARAMLDRLAALGMPLDWESLRRRYTGSLGRPHIARAMVRAGYVDNMQEAFERYLGHDKPAYVAGERMCMEEALPLLRRNGFVPVLAHPCELRMEEQLLIPLIEKWQSLGLMGVEVYHPSAAALGYTTLDRIARRMGLLVTGGSDFHQANDKHGRLGCMLDAWQSCHEDTEALREALHREAGSGA